METSIKKNDSFLVLCKITGLSERELEDNIVNCLIKNELIEQHFTDYGKTLQEIINENEWLMSDFVKLSFPKFKDNFEFMEIIKTIKIWGTAGENQCPECGCELEVTDDSFDNIKWTELKCENPNCEYTITNEPDWDY